MNKPTPGPWYVEPDQASQGAKLCVVDAEGEVIARTPMSLEGSEARATDAANARLIAAAPGLLEALKLALGGEPAACFAEAARAAIAKAEGR